MNVSHSFRAREKVYSKRNSLFLSRNWVPVHATYGVPDVVFLVFHSRNFIIRVIMFVYHRNVNIFFSINFNANSVRVSSAIQNPNFIQTAWNYRSIPIVVRGKFL